MTTTRPKLTLEEGGGEEEQKNDDGDGVMMTAAATQTDFPTSCVVACADAKLDKKTRPGKRELIGASGFRVRSPPTPKIKNTAMSSQKLRLPKPAIPCPMP